MKPIEDCARASADVKAVGSYRRKRSVFGDVLAHEPGERLLGGRGHLDVELGLNGLAQEPKVILFDGAPEAKDGDWVITLADVEAKGAEKLAKDPRAVEDVIAGIKKDQLATLITRRIGR